MKSVLLSHFMSLVVIKLYKKKIRVTVRGRQFLFSMGNGVQITNYIYRTLKSPFVVHWYGRTLRSPEGSLAMSGIALRTNQ